MITGKQLRDARKKKKITAKLAADRAGITVGTLYRWENSKSQPRDKVALSRLRAFLDISTSVTLDTTAKSKKNRAGLKKKADIPVVTATPPGVETTTYGHGGSDRLVPADIGELAIMLGFFVSDPDRQTNLGRLLKAAVRTGLTIHGLERAIDGNG